jgi:hypothetical protein
MSKLLLSVSTFQMSKSAKRQITNQSKITWKLQNTVPCWLKTDLYASFYLTMIALEIQNA